MDVSVTLPGPDANHFVVVVFTFSFSTFPWQLWWYWDKLHKEKGADMNVLMYVEELRQVLMQSPCPVTLVTLIRNKAILWHRKKIHCTNMIQDVILFGYHCFMALKNIKLVPSLRALFLLLDSLAQLQCDNFILLYFT